MNKDIYFPKDYELLKPLSKSETIELLIKVSSKDEIARLKLIKHNIRLVIYEVKTKFNNVNINKEDLVASGIIGLIKAISSFNINKNVEFATYATVCIDNEILMSLRNFRKHNFVESLDKVIYSDDVGNELTLKDILSRDENIIDYYVTKETFKEVRNLVNNLPEVEKKVIKMRFGFYNDKIYTEKEIAEKVNFSQSYTSRFIKKILKRLKNEIENTDKIKKIN